METNRQAKVKGDAFLAVADSYASNLYFAAMGDEDITTAKLGNELYFNTVYTKNGLLRNDAAQRVRPSPRMYITAEAPESAAATLTGESGTHITKGTVSRAFLLSFFEAQFSVSTRTAVWRQSAPWGRLLQPGRAR